jgi:hypothetical protein
VTLRVDRAFCCRPEQKTCGCGGIWPVDALKAWRKKKPELFNKRVL